ncbi:hypothetical protein KI387_028210, partial [Taxus chinensis]
MQCIEWRPRGVRDPMVVQLQPGVGDREEAGARARTRKEKCRGRWGELRHPW